MKQAEPDNGLRWGADTQALIFLYGGRAPADAGRSVSCGNDSDMPNLGKLISVFEEARELVADPGNDFSWSSWVGRDDAVDEIDGILSVLRSGAVPKGLSTGVLFAPTGPMQEVSLSSGWGGVFLMLAERFDEAMAASDT
jgi:hypothetical protein